MLYEYLTGDQPFSGGSMEQQIVAHQTLDPPRPSDRNPAIPRGCDEVVATGMAKKPEQRYHSAGELAAAARRALVEAPSPAETASAADPTRRRSPVPTPHRDTPPPATRSNRKWLIAAAVILVVVVAGSFSVTGPRASMQGAFASEGGRTVIRDGLWHSNNGICTATVTGTKQ